MGGGPSGCVVAILLARSGCSVAVADKSRAGRFCIGETLPPQCSRLLAKLDLLDMFEAQGPLPSAGIVSAWGTAELLAKDFIFHPHGNGWHIDRANFNRMLIGAATDAGVTFFNDTAVEACDEDSEGWHLGIAGPGVRFTLTCRLIIDARGRAATGRFPFPRRTVFDRLIAVAGTASPRKLASRSDFTLIEAVDQGWFYSALLPCGEYMVAYMTDADLFAAGRARSSSHLEDQLTKAPHTRERIEAIPRSVALFSAVTSVRDVAACRNWLAVGDAAQSFDPLSGQGLASAMAMARQCAWTAVRMLAGDATARIEYDHANSEAFAQYRAAHRSYYCLEHRWPESEFWRRRQG